MIENKAKKGTSTKHLDALARKVRKIQKDLLKKIHESLKNQNRPDIYSKYQNAQCRKQLQSFIKKILLRVCSRARSPQELTKSYGRRRLQTKKNYGKEFPELANRERLKN